MSVQQEIYNILAADPFLIEELAKSILPGAELKPAIYETWPANNAPMPYVICSYTFPPGQLHWAQVAGSLNIDVFAEDSTQAENIKNRVMELLHFKQINTEAEGYIKIYLGGNDGEILEPEPEVCHWNTTYDVKFWRRHLIKAVTQ